MEISFRTKKQPTTLPLLPSDRSTNQYSSLAPSTRQLSLHLHPPNNPVSISILPLVATVSSNVVKVVDHLSPKTNLLSELLRYLLQW
jgi:hypothetical protein